MATTTPNFGWAVPTSTDLVKDGAVAIETLGDSIDASLVDLKGGTTGQVLAKASATDMDFSWVAADDSNAIQNAIVDAKGDLIAASANDTPARLAVGSNGDTLVADSSQTTGLRYNPTTGNQNYVINGGFDFFQRGTSGTPGTGTYLADRWISQNANAATISQQSTGAPNNSRYVMRIATTGSGQYANMATMLETSMAQQLWGSAATLQVKLRRNATFNTTITIYLQKSATVDAGNGATWTSIGTSTITNANLPTGTGVTDWVTATVTGTIPNDGTANSLRVLVAADAATGAGAYWEMAQVKLEAGSVATAFTRSGGTIQGELAACQRYYYRNTATGSSVMRFCNGSAASTTIGYMQIYNPVVMRVNPTAIEYGGTIAMFDGVTVTNITTLTLEATGRALCNLQANVASGLTQYRPYVLTANNDSTAYIGLTAEL